MEVPKGKEEAKKMQGAWKLIKDEEMAWAPPRNKSDWPDWEEARGVEKARGSWSQKGKRRCQRSLSCRMRSKARTWTLMAKATESRQKQQFLEDEREVPGEEERRHKILRVESEETQDNVEKQRVRCRKKWKREFLY